MPDQLPPGTHLSVWASMPFVALLLAIAVAPLIDGRWWGKYFPVVSIGLGAVTVAYYVVFLGSTRPILHSAVEYLSFIALVGSLYVITGGIHIRLRGRSTPLANIVLLAFGAVLSNLVGTTGASMILIRPYLHVNRYRIKAFHVVFFIFIVSNIGGAMTPVGDPPLFLGYLQGIPFFWPMRNLWGIWLLAVTIVLGVFYFWDRRDFVRLSRSEQHRTEDLPEHGEVVGWHNLFFLVIVLGAVFVTHPAFLREALMVSAALGSYFSTRADVHRKNNFDFVPIKEVAILFLGIFMTMVPALEWIEQNSAAFGLQRAEHFFWSAGALSSVLDNAPTYLNFLSAAIGRFVTDGVVQQILGLVRAHNAGAMPLVGGSAPDVVATFNTLMKNSPEIVSAGTLTYGQVATAYLLTTQGLVVQAISVGAVFFGAMTYIGNGPNLMVKSIAEQSGMKCPSFGAYIGRYAVPVLLPTFIVVWLVFFRA